MTDVVLRSGIPAETMIKDTIESLEADLHIITGEGATVQTNKFLISQGSTILKSILSHDISPCVLLLPDLTASALNHFIRIITKGVTSGHGRRDKILKEVREAAQVLGFENIPELSFEAEMHSPQPDGHDLRPSVLMGVIGDLNEESSLDLANMDILIKIELEENQHSPQPNCQDLHVNGQDLHIKIELEENQDEHGREKLCLNDEDIMIPGSSTNDEHNTVGLNNINISENSFITKGSRKTKQDEDEHNPYDQNSNREVRMVDIRQGQPHCQEPSSPSKSNLSSSTNLDVSNQGRDALRLSKRKAKRKNISSQSNVVPKEINIQAQKERGLRKCKMCNYKTKYKSNLTKHIQADHKGILHSCKKCNFKTKYKFYLNKHFQAEHEGVLYSCKTCNYETKYRNLLSTHIQAEHEGVLYSCKTCNYETKYKGELKKHIQAEHEGILHSCKMCNFKTKYRNNLSRHIRAEHGGLLHFCKMCNYNTKYKPNLTKHIQTQHDGVLY